jgi:hypothetical protein
MGLGTSASGTASTAMGLVTSASGNASTAMGEGTTAHSYGETVIGTYNTAYTPNSTSVFNANDRLFVVGNGSMVSRSNALTILKNGNLTVNGATTINNNATITGTFTTTGLVTTNGGLTNNGTFTNNGNATITGTLAVGTITSGVWSGTAIAVEKGGTGATSAASALTNLGAAPLASPTFTGTVGGITKSMVGLGNVDNTTDAGKPVSTAVQTALDLKAPLASPTFTGTVTAQNYKLTVPSSITSGETTTIDLSTGNIFKINLGTSITTLTINNAQPGTYILEFIQGGSRTVSFPGGWRWSGGSAPTITATADKIDIVTLVYDGTTYFASAVQNF